MAKKTNTTKKVRIPAVKADWYTDQGMMGHIWAKETYRNAYAQLKPLARKQAQKDLLRVAINFNNVNWHYWCSNVSKKDIAQVKHCLKSIAKGESWYEMWTWVSHRHGMLVDNFLSFLEVKAYEEDTEKFLADTTRYYTSLGMPKAEAENRIHRRIANYKERLGI